MRTSILVAVLALGGCSDRDKPDVKREPERPRRVIEPASRGVRALPPYAIRADGVGPYKLGASASEVLEQLPSGPRIQQFSIPDLVHIDMLRGDEDAILIGTEPQGKATFVAVVDRDIARTEAGIQVGSTRTELEHALGAPLEDPDHAHDPRLAIPSKLDNAHVVLDDDRVAAIVLTPPVERSKEIPAVAEHACARPQPGAKAPAANDAGVAELSPGAKGTVGACLVSGELVRVAGDEVTVLARDTDKPIVTQRIAGLVFAAPLRNPIDGRDDLIAVTRTADPETRTWTLTVYRLIDNKLMRVIEPWPLYQITSANARWIGADLDAVDLLLEASSKSDAIEVGGLLTTRIGGKIRDIVVISTVPVQRRKVKPPVVETVDAGVPDAVR